MAVEVQSSTARSTHCIMRNEDSGDIDERERCATGVKGKRHTIFFLKNAGGVVSRRHSPHMPKQNLEKIDVVPARNTEAYVKRLCNRP